MSAVVVVAGRVAACPRVVPGSTREACDRCGTAVWVSPASWTRAGAFGGLLVMCLECAARAQGGVRGRRLLGPSPEQVAEAESMGQAAAAVVRAWRDATGGVDGEL